MPQDYKRPPQILSAEEKTFIKLVAKGEKRTHAFRMAFPNHPTVKRYLDTVKSNDQPEERKRHAVSVNQLAKNKIQTKRIRAALVTYQRKMDEFSDLSLDTAIDLVQNARSEKVRSDLAIEGIRHRVGTPVQKMQVQQQEDIIITFGEKSKVIDIDDDGVIE